MHRLRSSNKSKNWLASRLIEKIECLIEWIITKG